VIIMLYFCMISGGTHTRLQAQSSTFLSSETRSRSFKKPDSRV
jgi:hypothetical protein